MKRTIIIITAMVLFGFKNYAQNTVNTVLTEVEKNNTTLSAYRKSVDAEKIGNKTGLTPQNPEVEFNYLWGSPSPIGNRTDFSIKQSFDFPTVYSYKNQISDSKNVQVELEFKKQRNEVLHQTRLVCVKLTYYNALHVELKNRHVQALKIADAYKTKFNAGDVGILDYNKAQINLLNVSKELENIEIEQAALLLELTTLNGGKAITFSDSVFSVQTIPADFETWFSTVEANNPVLQWIKQEIAISEKQVKLSTAQSLPKFSAGYMSEKVVGEQFQGVSVGVSIPLWENKNTVKYAKAQSIAIQSLEVDAKQQFYGTVKSAHAKAVALQQSVADYSSKLSIYSNTELLEKAFNKGEISLTEYMYELSLYYESKVLLLESEMNLHVAFAELQKL